MSMFEVIGRDALWRAFWYLAAGSFAVFLYHGYQARLQFRRAAKQDGVFLLPHSWIFGHILVIAKSSIKHKAPADSHGQFVPLMLAEDYPEVMKAGCVYMDVWPVSGPMLSVFHPDMIAQFTQEKSQLKHPQLLAEFKPFSGGTDLVVSEGQEWKASRSIFNPGFSAKNLLSLIPAFVEEALVCREKMKKLAASGEITKLESLTMGLTLDVIGRAVLGVRLHAQQRPVKMMQALVSELKVMSYTLNLFKKFHPLRLFRHWKGNRVFLSEIMPYVKNTALNYEKIDGPKTILNLALKSYVDEVQDISARGNIPYDFLVKAANHIKMFLFAGHDTTATALAYAYYELSQNPKKAALLRTEHDAVLGTDPTQAAERITANPTLLNQMPYSLAVIKETLRLWPPFGTVRIGEPNFFLRNPDTGVRYPAGGFMLFGCSSASQRHPLLWPEANSFIPERFLVRDENDPLYPVKNAFRPFEHGPRNCIGQELVTLELRLILALTVREFDVEICYKDNAPTFMGVKAYQVIPDNMVTSHPKDGLPVRIRARS